MKILIVSPCDLPIPAVKGGAVATLIESILKENEKIKKLDITVVTSWSHKAEMESKKYCLAKFIWCKIPLLIKMIDKIIDRFRKKIKNTSQSKEYLRKLYVILIVRKALYLNNYDAVILQNSGYLLKIFEKNKIFNKYKNKIYYHLHNDIPTNANIHILKQIKFLLISQYLTKKLFEMCGRDVAERCYILKNGICCENFSKHLNKNEKKELKMKLTIAEEQKVVMFVGRIVPEKGLDELLEAIEKITELNIVLLIIGSTNFGMKETSVFESKIKEKCMKLGDIIRFTGFIHNSELWKYYSLADIAVLPSIWEEPAGLTMIEAASAGIPVITTKAGGIPEYLNSKYSILLERDELLVSNIQKAILEVIANQKEWKERAMLECRYVFENFSESNLYNNFLKIISENSEAKK